jgi:HNH endonuclease
MPHKDPVVERAYRRRKYHANIEARREKNRLDSVLFRQRHPDKMKAQNDSYRQRNLEKERERSRIANQRRRKEHPDKVHAYEQAYRPTKIARKKGAPIYDLTHEQWVAIQEAQDHRCAYCGKRFKWRLTRDHITPLAKNGPHTLHNVIGACKSCNCKKHTGPPLKPVQPLLL